MIGGPVKGGLLISPPFTLQTAMFKCNRCNEEIEDDGGIGFSATLPAYLHKPSKKSSVEGKLCTQCADEIFADMPDRTIAVRFAKTEEAI
jgi:hypothetical protein